MISKKFEQECYVYITLPNQKEQTLAGRFVLSVNKNGIALGKFVYGKSFLQNPLAVAIDPVELKLGSDIYETIRLNGIFGALRDSSPDYWGRRVIDKYSGKTNLSEMDYLLNSPDDRVGALGFGLNQKPPAPKREFNKTIELEKLQDIADAIIKEQKIPANADNTQIENLMLVGTSMGGARPKTVVEDNEGLWIAKFNRHDDSFNQARVEQSMLVLAKKSGLNVPESKIVNIGNRDVLLVKRFDREKADMGYFRNRMISALTALKAEDSDQTRNNWSYIALAEEVRRISSEPKKDAEELFRRMCFNALISNTDDHPRNHAFIAKGKDWRLSPAYDLTPSMPISLEHRDLAMICGDYGRFANAKNLLSQHARFLLEEQEALTLIRQIKDCVKNNWYAVARNEGVTEADCNKIAPAFVYKGFDNDIVE